MIHCKDAKQTGYSNMDRQDVQDGAVGSLLRLKDVAQVLNLGEVPGN